MKNIGEAFYLRPWAIREDVLLAMSAIVQRHLSGAKLSKDEIKAVTDSRRRTNQAFEVVKGVARIPIQGVIAKRTSMVNGISQPEGTAVTQIRKNIKAALQDKEVKAIALDIDSPGGSVDGVAELADFIFESRGEKPILAFADGMMASAAYFLGSSADQIFTTKSSEIGSIGVYAAIADMSVAAHNAGVKIEVIRSGKHKGLGYPGKVLTDDERSVVQEEVDGHFELFTSAILRNRDMETDELMPLATGRTFLGKKAIEVGLADEMGSIDEFISDFEDESKSNSSKTAQSTTKAKEDGKMDLKSLTKEQLKSENPVLHDALVALGRTQGVEEQKAAQQKGVQETAGEAVKTAVKTERERSVGIMNKLMVDEYKGFSGIAKAAIEDGKSIEAAESDMKDARIKALQKASPAGPGAGEGEADVSGLSVEERAKVQFNKSSALQKEFGSVSTYTSYMKNKDKGKHQSALAK